MFEVLGINCISGDISIRPFVILYIIDSFECIWRCLNSCPKVEQHQSINTYLQSVFLCNTLTTLISIFNPFYNIYIFSVHRYSVVCVVLCQCTVCYCALFSPVWFFSGRNKTEIKQTTLTRSPNKSDAYISRHLSHL